MKKICITVHMSEEYRHNTAYKNHFFWIKGYVNCTPLKLCDQFFS